MAAMMASTLAGSRPSEKLGTHSTSVDISGKDSWRRSREARPAGRLLAVANIYSVSITANMSGGAAGTQTTSVLYTRAGLGTGTAKGTLFALRRLLLRHAVHRAQPPYQVAGINGDHPPGREEFSQSVQRDAVIRIIEYGYEYDAVGDVEICVAGREPSPFKHNRPGHRQLDNVEGLAVLIMRGFESAEIVAERLVVHIFRIGLNHSHYRVGGDESG